ncbi:hypothetical protein KSS87_000126 [Heliosperma pusillum]|nr:hypothetical protein KSS87_000126 [Heliosperma pusillum]
MQFLTRKPPLCQQRVKDLRLHTPDARSRQCEGSGAGVLKSCFDLPFLRAANYKAVRCLSLNSLNGERSSLLLQNFMESGQGSSFGSKGLIGRACFAPLPEFMEFGKVQVFAQKHTVSCNDAFTIFMLFFHGLDEHGRMDLFHHAESYYKKAKYILLEGKGKISIVMHKDSTSEDVVQSYVHALVMASLMDKNTSLHVESRAWMDKHYEDFLKKLETSGWKTERLLTHSVVWKASWSVGLSDEKIGYPPSNHLD